ncbi:hypothetical protein U1839_11020 [Sphingomonas sp. RT2P30]|uniref:hypothetical protein n=1 Tax=Parasphingomonas halimpatiens TaxID=3096162 RepID=UPI002FCC298F
MKLKTGLAVAAIVLLPLTVILVVCTLMAIVAVVATIAAIVVLVMRVPGHNSPGSRWGYANASTGYGRDGNDEFPDHGVSPVCGVQVFDERALAGPMVSH